MNSIKKILKSLTLLIAFFILAFSVNAKGGGDQNGTGIDPVLQMAGIEKPAQWQSWSERQKHSWLQENGIFPQYGRKYEGRFDIDAYFEFIEREMPEDWDKRTFSERKEFVESAADISGVVKEIGNFEKNEDLEEQDSLENKEDSDARVSFEEEQGEKQEGNKISEISENESSESRKIWTGISLILLNIGIFAVLVVVFLRMKDKIKK